MSADWRIFVAGVVFLLAIVLFMNMETYTKDSKSIVRIIDGEINTINTDERNNEIMGKFDKISKAIQPGNSINFHLLEWYPTKPNDRHTQSGEGRCIHGGRGRCRKRGECRTSVECPHGLIPWDIGRNECTCAYARSGGQGGFTFKAE